MLDYADLKIEISPHDQGTYKIDLTYTPPGSDVEANPGEKPIIALNADELKAYHLRNDDYGQKLRIYLFEHEAVSKWFGRVRSAAGAHGLRVRLAIDPEATELHSLRWETLHDPDDSNSRLLTNQKCIFSRFLASDNTDDFSPAPKSELKALVAIANPDILENHQVFNPVDVDGELKRAQEGLGDIKITALGKVEKQSEFEGVEIRGQASLTQIEEELRHGCNIFYLACHGVLDNGKPELWLDPDEADKRVYIPGQDLVTRLMQLEQPPLLVILASCQGAGTGDQPRTSDEAGALAALGPQLARAGIPAVLAMQGSITMKTVSLFMPVLFRELAEDGRIDRAVAIARSKVQERDDWWMPVLFMRIKNGMIFKPDRNGEPPLDPDDGMVRIPAGTFTIGSEPGEDIPECETPPVEVHLPEYWISKSPIRVKEYAVFLREVEKNISSPPGWSDNKPPADCTETEPVQGVTWFEAVEYCEWLTKKTEKTDYSLPTEAQWEKAAKILSREEFEWGQIREWTRTIWGIRRVEPDENYRYPYPENDDERNKLDAGHYLYRVYRGKGFLDDSNNSPTTRGAFLPYHRGPRENLLGFRVVFSNKSNE